MSVEFLQENPSCSCVPDPDLRGPLSPENSSFYILDEYFNPTNPCSQPDWNDCPPNDYYRYDIQYLLSSGDIIVQESDPNSNYGSSVYIKG